MIGSFVLFVEGVAVVGKGINLVDDLNVITILFDFDLNVSIPEYSSYSTITDTLINTKIGIPNKTKTN